MTVISTEQYLSKILLEIYDSANRLFNDKRWKGSEETFLKLQEEGSVLFACSESKPVGFLSYSTKICDCTVITGLYVTEEYQNKKIATGLMKALLNCRANKTIFAEVINNAVWAKNFYEKHNFNIISKDYCLSEELKQIINHNPWSCIYMLS